MKKVFLVVFLLSIGFCGSSVAEDKKHVKWKVNIEIQYNAVDRAEAERIISRVMAQNETACKAKAITKKVDGEGVYVTFGTASSDFN